MLLLHSFLCALLLSFLWYILMENSDVVFVSCLLSVAWHVCFFCYNLLGVASYAPCFFFLVPGLLKHLRSSICCMVPSDSHSLCCIFSCNSSYSVGFTNPIPFLLYVLSSSLKLVVERYGNLLPFPSSFRLGVSNRVTLPVAYFLVSCGLGSVPFVMLRVFFVCFKTSDAISIIYNSL